VRPDVDEWLRLLPEELAPHRDVMRSLLRAALQDSAVRLLVVGCSIGRGAADALSDIDALIGITDGAWATWIDGSALFVRSVGEIVDLYQQIIEPTKRDEHAYQHTFAQYASGVQLDLVVAPARERQAPRPDWVVLYDPDERVHGEPRIGAANEEHVRQWMYVGLVHLNACAKYLTRGSLWEAKLQLDAARTELWRLWAAAERVADPEYGLTAILDSPRTAMPRDIEATAASLERGAIASAANVCLDLFDEIWPRAIAAAVGETAPSPALVGWVRKRLRSIPT
jgi:hypothetical protein